jgi:uncharacterized protein
MIALRPSALRPGLGAAARMLLAGLIAVASTLVAAATVPGAVPVPPMGALVTDLTGTLTPEQQSALESRLRQFSERKGSQLAVLIVPTTAPETIEAYSLRVVEQWKVGRKKVDDGALLLVAKDDRALRIEVGYGLEGALPDAIAKRIISEVIAPRFKDGDYFGGIDAGTDRIMRIIDGEPLPAATPPAEPGLDVGRLLPLVLLVAFALGGVLRALLGRVPGAAVTSACVGGLAWFLSGLWPVAAIGALVAFVFTLAGLGTRGGLYGLGGGRGIGGGGFGGGGGGRFGGGGASGRW